MSSSNTMQDKKDKIYQPKHSRPIDVHRWSDHPEVVKLVEELWSGSALDNLLSNKGPKPKR